jgi:hypothetical protein
LTKPLYLQTFVCQTLYQVYNHIMSRDHFSKMYKDSTRRHDSISNGDEFNKDMALLTGMLYSVVTLKAFFPMSPAPEKSANPVNDSDGGIK